MQIFKRNDKLTTVIDRKCRRFLAAIGTRVDNKRWPQCSPRCIKLTAENAVVIAIVKSLPHDNEVAIVVYLYRGIVVTGIRPITDDDFCADLRAVGVEQLRLDRVRRVVISPHHNRITGVVDSNL